METSPVPADQPPSPAQSPTTGRPALVLVGAFALVGLFFAPWVDRNGGLAASPFGFAQTSTAGTFLWLLPGSALLLVWAVVSRRQVPALGAVTGLLHLILLGIVTLGNGLLLAPFNPVGVVVGLTALTVLLATAPEAAIDVEPLLGGLNRQPSHVLRHWYAYVEDFSTSPQEFYSSVEAEIGRRNLPKVEVCYLNRSEGNVLVSPRRLYLRLRQTDTLFDLCAAPFGTGFFFSFRVSALPFRFGLLDAVIVAFVLGFGGLFFMQAFGLILGGVLSVALVALAAVALWRSPRFHAGGLDDLLLSLRVVGPLYYHFFRARTLYREDATLVYLQAVERIFRRQVDELTLAHGVKLSRTFDYDQVLGGAYEERPKQLALDLANPLRVVNDAQHP
jgi:hypothetical protein